MTTQMQYAEHYAPSRDGRVYYKVLGEGYPTVFLHACPAGAWSFDSILPEFAKDFTCYAVDMPGFDHSDLPDHPFTLKNFASAIVDVLKDAKIERANFVGVRTGAVVSLAIAAYYPELVSHLAIEGSPGWNRREGKIIFEKIFYPDYDEIGNPRVHPYEEAVINNPALNRERHERIQDSIRRRPEWYRWCHDMHTGTDIAALMPMVKAPTLVMFKELDPLRRREQRFLDEIKGSKLHIFSGQNGSSHEDNKEEYIEVVKAFLKE